MRIAGLILFFGVFGLALSSQAQTHKSLFKKGKAAYEANKLEEALNYFDQAVEKNKTNTPISLQSKVKYCNWRGATHVQLGNNQKAVSDLTYAIRNRKVLEDDLWVPHKTFSDYYWRGRAQLARGNASISLEDFDQALKINPNNGDAHYNQGRAFMALKEYDKAIKSFDKALLNGFERHDVYRTKGVCHYRLQNYQMAFQSYKKAYEMDNSDLSSLSGQALSNARLGRYAESVSLIDRAIEKSNGKDAYIFFQKARIEAFFGNEENILQNLEQSFDLGFDNWQAFSTYLSEFGAFAEDPRFIQLLIDNQAQIGLMGFDTIIAKINKQRNENLSYNDLKANPSTSIIEPGAEKTVRPMPKSDVDIDIPVTPNKNENHFAVVIGNENYNNEIPVKYAINDARSFKAYLKKTLGIPESNIHYVEDATYGQLLDEIDWITKIINAFQEEARVFFYYAGHGVPNDETRDAFLLPTDGNSIRTNTAVSLKSLFTNLSEGNASSVTVFLDACFSGGSREGALTEGRGVRIKPKEETLEGKLVVFSAASGDQTAYPYSDEGHGLFTYFVLKKLQESNGDASYGELADYVRSKVNQRAVILNGKNQNPQVNVSPKFSNWEELEFQ
ncbi:MAG: tetratricopeptide repeat protein [Bacteroidota bacterium]